MSKPPVPTAKEINDAHAYAKECADTAIEHAVLCGKLLAKKKANMPHGEFTDWVEQWCEFSPRTARKYMQVAEQAKQNGMSMPFSTMDKLLGYEKPASKPNTSKGAVPFVKAPADRPEATGETGTDRPAAPTSPPAAAPEPSPQAGEPEWTAEDEAAAHAAAEADYQERTEAAMAADDRLAEAFRQIKQQAALLANANAARDREMNKSAEVVRLLKAEQRKVIRLERELEKLRGQKAA